MPSNRNAEKVAAPEGHELRQQAREEDRYLGVAEIADQALPEGGARAQALAEAGGQGLPFRIAGRPDGFAQRLDAEKHQIGRAGIFDGQEERLRRDQSATIPALVAIAQIVRPLATPSAVKMPPARPPNSVLRMVMAVSGPGVMITTSATPTRQGTRSCRVRLHAQLCAD